jgi:hypothetical protein
MQLREGLTPFMAGVGGALVGIGSALTWVTVDLGFAEFSTTGLDTTDGKLTAAAALVIVTSGIVLAFTRGTMRAVASIVGLAATAFAAIVLINDYLDVRERIASTPADQATATVGIGVWVSSIGCLLALLAFAATITIDRRSAQRKTNAIT